MTATNRDHPATCDCDMCRAHPNPARERIMRNEEVDTGRLRAIGELVGSGLKLDERLLITRAADEIDALRSERDDANEEHSLTRLELGAALIRAVSAEGELAALRFLETDINPTSRYEAQENAPTAALAYANSVDEKPAPLGDPLE